MTRKSILSKNEVDALIETVDEQESESASSVSGALEEELQHLISEYSFQSPRLSAEDTFRKFIHLHDDFCRDLKTDLSILLRTDVAIRRVSVEQQKYKDFVFSVSEVTYMVLMGLLPLPGTAVIETQLSLVFGIVDLLLGGDGSDQTSVRKPTEMESSVWNPFMDQVLSRLARSMEPVMPIQVERKRTETNPTYAQAAPEDAAVVVVTLEAEIGLAKGIINLCYPLPMVQAILGKMEGSHGQLDSYYGQVEPADVESLIVETLRDVKLNVSSTLGHTWITARDWLTLQPGDVIDFDTPLDEPVTIEVEGCSLFKGRPGRFHQRLGVRIEERIGRLGRPEVLEKRTHTTPGHLS